MEDYVQKTLKVDYTINKFYGGRHSIYFKRYLHLSMDYKCLKIIIKNHYLLTLISEIIDQLAGANIFN